MDVNDLGTLTKHNFSLIIVDIPYRYKLKGSVFYEVAYKYKEIDNMVKSFKDLTLSPLWRFIIFHSTSQSVVVATALKEHTHAFETMCWYVRNLFILITCLLSPDNLISPFLIFML